jgi:hypothetical protein
MAVKQLEEKKRQNRKNIGQTWNNGRKKVDERGSSHLDTDDTKLPSSESKLKNEQTHQ